MQFRLKIEAKEEIKGNYLRDLLTVVFYMIPSAMYICLPVIAAVVYFFKPGADQEPKKKAIAIILIAGMTLALHILRECCRAWLYRRKSRLASDDQSGSIFLSAIHAWFTGAVLFMKKLLWLAVFLCPFLFCTCSFFILSDANVLYPITVRILTAANALLLLSGIVFYFVVTGRYYAVRFCSICNPKMKLRSVFRRNAAVMEQKHCALFLFRLTMLPWLLLAFFPFAAIYCLPYVFRCQINLKYMLFKETEAVREPAEADEIKIYYGKGTPAKSVPEC